MNKFKYEQKRQTYPILIVRPFYFQVLCLSPTYELAIQIGDVAMKMGQYCPSIKIRFAIRGEEGEF